MVQRAKTTFGLLAQLIRTRWAGLGKGAKLLVVAVAALGGFGVAHFGMCAASCPCSAESVDESPCGASADEAPCPYAAQQAAGEETPCHGGQQTAAEEQPCPYAAAEAAGDEQPCPHAGSGDEPCPCAAGNTDAPCPMAGAHGDGSETADEGEMPCHGGGDH